MENREVEIEDDAIIETPRDDSDDVEKIDFKSVVYSKNKKGIFEKYNIDNKKNNIQNLL